MERERGRERERERGREGEGEREREGGRESTCALCDSWQRTIAEERADEARRAHLLTRRIGEEHVRAQDVRLERLARSAGDVHPWDTLLQMLVDGHGHCVCHREQCSKLHARQAEATLRLAALLAAARLAGSGARSGALLDTPSVRRPAVGVEHLINEDDREEQVPHDQQRVPAEQGVVPSDTHAHRRKHTQTHTRTVTDTRIGCTSSPMLFYTTKMTSSYDTPVRTSSMSSSLT